MTVLRPRPVTRPRERSIATIHAALDAGVTLIDTADSYHRDAGEVGHNEELIAEALSAYGSDTSNVLVATKGGHLGGMPMSIEGRADRTLGPRILSAIGLALLHAASFHWWLPCLDHCVPTP